METLSVTSRQLVYRNRSYRLPYPLQWSKLSLGRDDCHALHDGRSHFDVGGRNCCVGARSQHAMQRFQRRDLTLSGEEVRLQWWIDKR